MVTIGSIGLESIFPIFGGDRILVLIAPDHPDAPYSERHSEHYWEFETHTGRGEVLAIGSARRDATGHELWSSAVSGAMYQSISSNETDRRTGEIRDWLDKVVEAYKNRHEASLRGGVTLTEQDSGAD